MKRLTLLTCGLLLIAGSGAYADWIDLPVKWSQPPDMDIGLDHLSIHGGAAGLNGPIVADDYLSLDDAPVVALRWWGSYVTSTGEPPPDYQPPPGFAVPFHVSFYSDVPAGVDPNMPWSHPGKLLLEQTVRAQEELWGTVPDPEVVFVYNAKLQVPFQQGRYHDPAGQPTIFWIGIDRLDREDWGWHEAVTMNLDDAVTGPHLGPWTPLFKKKLDTVSADMAFEVMVPEPATLLLLASGGLLAGIRRGKT